MFKFSFLLLLIVDYVYCCFDNNIEHVDFHFATTTPYRNTKNSNDSEIIFKECKAIRMWGIIRHGSRNPSKNHIRKMRNNLVNIKQKIINSKNKLCEHDLLNLKNWKPQIDESQAKLLVAEGEDELIELAERMQNRFPNLLRTTYDNTTFKFKYTSTQRTELSAKSFVTGLFGRENIKQIWYPESLDKDPVLRFYKLCTRWKKDVNKNPNAYHEVNSFTESLEMQNTLNIISSKLGISDLTWSDIKLIYTTCAFETAVNKHKISPWCVIFDRNTIKILEYLKDLEHYWIDGYGYQITYKQACPVLVDIFNHIRPASSEPNITLYFSHSGTILKLLAYLKLYKDENPLVHSERNSKRKWKVSEIDSFGSNIVFILYNCKNHFYILTMHQEKIIHLPNCPKNNDLCDYDVFFKNFENDFNDCKFNEMCENN